MVREGSGKCNNAINDSQINSVNNRIYRLCAALKPARYLISLGSFTLLVPFILPGVHVRLLCLFGWGLSLGQPGEWGVQPGDSGA